MAPCLSDPGRIPDNVAQTRQVQTKTVAFAKFVKNIARQTSDPFRTYKKVVRVWVA